ncbi:Fe2+-dependent dioxygenase [Roseomonas sp. CCTCC AB2023176]|uniref:Fe2+-dependent dioxygenase n=1 Tax=Roseomonas sp. CCTCC AB2023176 TaxID=3342640 RepID=UPI0035E34B73
MIVPIGGVLDPDRLSRIRALLSEARFEDGRRTAGWHAREAKRNEQAAADDPRAREAAAMVSAALLANAVFRAAALPRRLRPVLLARYRCVAEGSPAYDLHVDDALMGMSDPSGPTRADVSVTVFLADPGTYEGGELVLDSPGGEAAYKLGAGDAIAYPATTLHRVAPVTAGERLVAVTWAQSLVRDPAAREVLFDLAAARIAVHAREGAGETFHRIARSYANLLRMWAET